MTRPPMSSFFRVSSVPPYPRSHSDCVVAPAFRHPPKPDEERQQPDHGPDKLTCGRSNRAELGGFLDAEAPIIEALGRALSLSHVGQSIRALHLLHRGEGEPDREVIETAIGHLTDLRDHLLAIPNGAPVVTPQALQGMLSSKDVDNAIRFMGARVDDQIAALLYANDLK